MELNETFFSGFDLTKFHFLRPLMLYGFIPLLLSLLFFLIGYREKSKWKRKIVVHLRRYVIAKGDKMALYFMLFAYGLVGALMVLALAGPTWELEERPGAKSQAIVLVALDVSSSMLTEDIQPNRLERAKLKLRDFYAQNPMAETGLLVFAGTPHIVIPKATDYGILTHQLEFIQPDIMPVKGRNFPLMMQMIDSMFSTVKAPSTLVLISDQLQQKDYGMLQDFISKSVHKVVFIPMATAKGGRIPVGNTGRFWKGEDGKSIVSVLELPALYWTPKQDRFTLQFPTLDNSDMEFLAKEVRENLEFTDQEEVIENVWKDRGMLLLPICALLLLLWFRKGFVLQWSWLLVWVVLAGCSVESSHADWWYSDDYIAQHYMELGEYAKAADKYNSLEHKAAAYFADGNYDAAAALYAMDSSARGHYNLGLTLMQLKDYDGAIQAFNNASVLDSTIAPIKKATETARHLQNQIDSVQRFEKPNENQVAKSKEQGPLKERKASSKDESLTSDTEVEELPKSGDRITDEVATDIRKAEEMDFPEEQHKEKGVQLGAQKVLLKKATSNPSEFLRKRFLLQKRRFYPKVKPNKNKW